MNKVLNILISGVFFLAFAGEAKAETFSVSVGYPIRYQFSNLISEMEDDYGEFENDSNPFGVNAAGFLLHVKLPTLIGFGMENYWARIISKGDNDLNGDGDINDDRDTEKGETYRVTFNMFDVFYLFPIPVINATIGAGVGTADFNCEDKCDDRYSFDTTAATMWQWYAKVGFPLLTIIDVHVGYHQLQTMKTGKVVRTHKATNVSRDLDFNPSGKMYSIGFMLSF